MSKINLSLTFHAVMLACGLHATTSYAQMTTTFVSATRGDNANPCTFVAPCRSFQAAHDNTFPDGQITVLDPGTYGAVTITKSISIVNDGVGEASIPVSGGGTGITVNAPATSGYVNIRGITVQGIGFGGGTGLRFNSGFSLTIENCIFRNHTLDGISFLPSSGSSRLLVSNTLVADNGGHGILVQPNFSASAKAVFTRVKVANNSQHGIFVSADASVATGINGAVVDSVASGNGSAGFAVSSGAGFGTSFLVTRSVIAGNQTGLFAISSAAILRVGQSAVTGNGVSWAAPSGGTVQSYGDNDINGNADGDPAPAAIAKK